jgi:hypothetical protein
MKPAFPAILNASAIGGDGGFDRGAASIRAGVDDPPSPVRVKDRLTKTAPANDEGRFSYFDFCDEDLMRSSSFRNSAVSSSIDLEGGLGGKGSTSDKVGPPLVYVRAVHSFQWQLPHFCGARVLAGSETALNNSNSALALRWTNGDKLSNNAWHPARCGSSVVMSPAGALASAVGNAGRKAWVGR